MASTLSNVVLRSGLLASENSVESERNCLPKELIRSEMESIQLKGIIIENVAALKRLSTRLLDMKEKLLNSK